MRDLSRLLALREAGQAAEGGGGTRWGLRLTVGEPVRAETTPDSDSRERAADVRRMSQEWMDQFEPWLRAHLEDWHMLQRVFVSDLDPERLARARARAAEEGS